MRKSAKALGLVVISFLAAVVLGVGSAFSAALAFGAVGLIVPGTGTPNANIVDDYLANARDYYLQGTACTNEANCAVGTDLIGIDYPASFWPLAVFPSWCRSGPDGCDKWDESVGKGADGLTTALGDALASPEPNIVIFGYSQGGAVVSKVLHDYGLTEEEKARIQVVTIGGIENPDGGLWQRLAFLQYIPIFNITFAPPMPVDPAIKTTTIGFEYDPVVYAPRYWGNPFAMLNAIAAFDNVHGYYLAPNGNDPEATLPYGYTPGPGGTLAPQLVCNVGVNCRKDQYGNEYIMIPATSLPIMNLVMSLTPGALKPIVKPLVDLISPVYKVLADLGYDWSGNPGVPTPLSILPFNPFQNPITVGVDLINAVIQGIHDAINGGPALAPAAPAPLTTSTLAARSIAPETESAEADATESLASVTSLESAKKSEPVATETEAADVVDAAAATDDVTTTPVAEPTQPTATPTTPSASDDTPAAKPEEAATPESTTPATGAADDTTKDAVKKDDVKKDADQKDAADAGEKAAA
jgi:pimeloyl-ACP methyl ester carboxylesterase